MQYLDLRFQANLSGPRQLLPPFLGATLRGAFGYVLKETVCQVKNVSCRDCFLKSACPYSAVFEGLSPEHREILRKYENIPQPFVLLLPFEDQPNNASDTIHWGIRLFGPAIRFWPYVIHSFQTIGDRGLGSNQLNYEITRIESGQTSKLLWDRSSKGWGEPCIETTDVAQSSSPLPDHCTIKWKFETPLNMRRKGPINGLDIVLAGRRRHEIMNYFYSKETQNGTSTVKPFLEASEFRVESDELQGFRFSRYSGRQKRQMKLSGVVGEIVITGPWGTCGDWLYQIPTLFLGKSTSFGFGNVSWHQV